MKKLFIRSCFALILITIVPVCTLAQPSFFSGTSESSLAKAGQKRVIVPDKYRVLQLDTTALLPFLRSAPPERSVTNRNTAPVIALPMPDGTTASFHIWESSAMAPELAARFPNLKTFTGQGITDPTATIKLDWTELGFHAQILSPVTTAVYIDPYAQGTVTNYISYFKKDFKKKEPFTEGTPIKIPGLTGRFDNLQSEQCVGQNLRTYRLAVACTGEYARAATGLPSPTVGQVLSAIVTTVNRVNGVYEKEIDLRIVLVASETNVVFTDPATDPFNGNSNAYTLIDESQRVMDSAVGNANYDMGHTFSTGGGGLSDVGVTCQTGYKAESITGSSVPVGDPYDIDYVAHEMGHSIGANHPFNSNISNCGGNGSSSTNTEPGSGSTIMAYAGICGSDNLQPHSDPQFQAINLDEISSYIFNNTGNTCGTLTATGNTPPVVNAGANYVIPKSTPFLLTGSATDADGDVLSYSWEEIDKGGPFGAWNAPSGNAPLFRSFQPVNTPVRYFPKLSDQINNTTTIGELLPSYARTMHFRLTARDNRAGGGGVCFDSMSIKVDGAAAPFMVTSPTAAGIVWYVNDFKTITWDVSTTTLAPISCANVTIQLSTDGGNTYPITLMASTPNDGSEEIQVPNNISTTARIRVMAVGNIFYDMSNNNFTIQASPTADFVFNTPTAVTTCGASNPSIILKTGALSGFTNPVALTAGNVPAGTTVSFSTNPLSPGSNTIVVLNNANTLANGTYTITITGTSTGASTKTKDITFVNSTTPAAPASLSAPVAYAIGVATQPTFSWASVSGASSYILEISTAANFSSIIQTVANIPANTYILTAVLAENTTYYWRVKTTNICGTGAASAASIFKTRVSVCNFVQDFVSVTLPPTNMTIVNPNNNVSWTRSTIGNGTAGSAFIDNYNNDFDNQVDDIRTVPFAPGSIDSVTISFDLAYKNYPSTVNYDTLSVLVSFDSGTSFTSVYSKSGPTLATAGSSSSEYISPAATDWRRDQIKIGSTYLASGSLIAAFRNKNKYGNNIFIDNINVCYVNNPPITYTFTGNGNWSSPANWSDNTIPPATLPANAAIEINPATGGQCILDITQHISANARLTVKSGKIIIVPGSVIVH